MKTKSLLVEFFFLIFLSNTLFAQQDKNIQIACKNYSIESAVRFMEMAEKAQNGILPDDEAWRQLFATEGYHCFFSACRDSLEWQQNIRTAFQVVFDKSQQARLDSVVSQPLNGNGPFLNNFIVNFNSLKNRLDVLNTFIHDTDFSMLLHKAHAKALQYLPARINDLHPTFTKFYFLSWDLEDRTWSNGIYFDLTTCYEDGEEGLINVMAHELHHHYMGALLEDRFKKDPKDAALWAIIVNQQEGTADIINKQKMPVEKLGLYGPMIVKIYNDDYNASPEVLKQLDNLTCDYLAGKITEKQYEEARQCAHFGGHTTGDFMVFLIRDQLGLQAAIDCFCDFPAFIRRYNEAAVKADTYVFSDTFVEHINKVCQEMEKE